jgi:hypothetical protein
LHGSLCTPHTKPQHTKHSFHADQMTLEIELLYKSCFASDGFSIILLHLLPQTSYDSYQSTNSSNRITSSSPVVSTSLDMQYHYSFLTILAGAVFVAAFPSHKGSEPIRWINCTENVPPVFSASYPTSPTSTIPPNLKCGNLVVPMDYANPISSCNNITLSLAMYRPVNPKGVIF